MMYLSFPDDILVQLPLLLCSWPAEYEFSQSCYILSWNATCGAKNVLSILLFFLSFAGNI